MIQSRDICPRFYSHLFVSNETLHFRRFTQLVWFYRRRGRRFEWRLRADIIHRQNNDSETNSLVSVSPNAQQSYWPINRSGLSSSSTRSLVRDLPFGNRKRAWVPRDGCTCNERYSRRHREASEQEADLSVMAWPGRVWCDPMRSSAASCLQLLR